VGIPVFSGNTVASSACAYDAVTYNWASPTNLAGEFTPFTINLDEHPITGHVDSASIYVYTTGREALGASWVVLDNFRLDGFADLNEIIVGQSQPNSEGANAMKLKVYPNPGTETVTLEFENSNSQNFIIEFIDVLGRVSKSLTSAKDSKAFVDTKNLPKGVYSIRIQDEKSTVSRS
jgi:hypothetical protein